MTLENPDVTVIVPTYNTGKYLDQCLETICANTVCRLEVLVINDGSTDNSLEIMRRHEANDSRIRVIDKPNAGYGSACNRGLNEARGTYVAIAEPDDYVLPGFYDAMFAFAQTFPELPEIVKTPYIRVSAPCTPHETLFHCAYHKRMHLHKQPFTLADQPKLFQYHPSIWSAMYLRSFIEEKQIRFMEVPGGGWVDNPFLAETLVQANSIAYLEEEFYCYREDLPGSSSANSNVKLAFTRWNNIADILDRLNVTDHGIRRAHVVRGVSYLTGIMVGSRVKGSPSEAMMKQMFERMDPVDVLENQNVSNKIKTYFCQVRGIEPKFSRLLFWKSLVGEFFFSLKGNGASYAFSRVRLYFERGARIKELNLDN